MAAGKRRKGRRRLRRTTGTRASSAGRGAQRTKLLGSHVHRALASYNASPGASLYGTSPGGVPYTELRKFGWVNRDGAITKKGVRALEAWNAGFDLKQDGTLSRRGMEQRKRFNKQAREIDEASRRALTERRRGE